MRKENPYLITIFDYFGYDTPYKERYKFIREVGFDGVLLFWSDEFGNKDYKLLPQYAREAGLYVVNILIYLKRQLFEQAKFERIR